MLEYLESSVDWTDPVQVSAVDDLPLWSAPFGLMLLEHIKMGLNMTVLDVGFGSGFPLLEISQRLGASSMVYGIDPWKEAIERAKLKIKAFNIKNVQLVEGDASSMDFADNTFDLIVSNTGVNNFEKPGKVFEECFRVAKPNGQIALTTNPKGHMEEFYRLFKETLLEMDMAHLMKALEAQIDHRLSAETINNLLMEAGFVPSANLYHSFVMRFVDGSAFLNHFLIRYGFLEGWRNIIPSEELTRVFTQLEKNLNARAEELEELRMTIPVAYIEAEKPG